LISWRFSGRSCVDELKSSGKPFEISKWEVQEAYERVKANKGAPGVDGCSIGDFEKDLKNNRNYSEVLWCTTRHPRSDLRTYFQ
jgi:hypothetical protein